MIGVFDKDANILTILSQNFKPALLLLVFTAVFEDLIQFLFGELEELSDSPIQINCRNVLGEAPFNVGYTVLRCDEMSVCWNNSQLSFHVHIACEDGVSWAPDILLESDLLAFVLALEGYLSLVEKVVRKDAIDDECSVLLFFDGDPVLHGLFGNRLVSFSAQHLHFYSTLMGDFGYRRFE